QSGVLDGDLYAALLLVVLVTTLATPQLLRLRYARLRAGRVPARVAPTERMPDGGWFRIEGGTVVLAGTPPSHLGLELGLRAAVLVAQARPSPDLLDWLSGLDARSFRWNATASSAFLDAVEHGNARSWRFLDRLGVLAHALPELAKALEARATDPFELDPAASLRWSTIERLQAVDRADPLATELAALAHPEWLLLAAMLLDVLDGRPDAVAIGRRVVGRLDLGASAEQEIALLLADRDLLASVVRQPDALSEESVLAIASHVDTPEQARALYVLSIARQPERERWEAERLRELHDRVQQALAQPELTGLDARNLAGRRRAEAARLVSGEREVLDRIEHAPRAYLLSQDATALAQHARLACSLGHRDAIAAIGDGRIDVAARDRFGLLASVTGVLTEAGLDIAGAVVVTWPDGVALESFQVGGEWLPDAERLGDAIEASLRAPLVSQPLPDAAIAFDDAVSPWHTVCEVVAPDKPGLLHSLATAFAAADV